MSDDPQIVPDDAPVRVLLVDDSVLVADAGADRSVELGTQLDFDGTGSASSAGVDDESDDGGSGINWRAWLLVGLLLLVIWRRQNEKEEEQDDDPREE